MARSQPTVAAATSSCFDRIRALVSGAGTPACDPALLIQRSSEAMSWALCQRSSGSLARHLSTTCSNAGGVSGCSSAIGRGVSLTIAAMRLVLVFPSNARCPVAISYSTAPREKMSVRASACSPSSCSGAMYWNVPTMEPSCVSGLCCVAASRLTSMTLDFARPKSSSFAPDFVIMMLPGFRSRCTIPARCALLSASATSMP